MDVSDAPNEGRVLKLSWTDMRHGDKGRLGARDTVSLSPTPAIAYIVATLYMYIYHFIMPR